VQIELLASETQEKAVIARGERQIDEHLGKVHRAPIEGPRGGFAAIIGSRTQLNEQACARRAVQICVREPPVVARGVRFTAQAEGGILERFNAKAILATQRQPG
jgi:hypothetical protein